MPGERLATASGAVRDGAAAIDGFAQLLGSRRVGPRGLGRALPEVREGCATLRAALQALGSALEEELGDDADAAEAARAVIGHADAEVAALEAEMARGQGAPPRRGGRPGADRGLDARQRLALEASVRRAARELEAALFLSDLLCAALDPRPTPLHLLDVLRERSPASARGSVRIAAVFEDGGDEGLEGDARVIRGLLDVAMGAVVGAGVASPEVRSRRTEEGRVEVRIGAARPGPAAGIALDLPLREGGARALAVARAAARRAGVALAIDADGRVVTLTR